MDHDAFLVIVTFGAYTGRMGIVSYRDGKWRCQFSSGEPYEDCNPNHWKVVSNGRSICDLLTAVYGGANRATVGSPPMNADAVPPNPFTFGARCFMSESAKELIVKVASVTFHLVQVSDDQFRIDAWGNGRAVFHSRDGTREWAEAMFEILSRNNCPQCTEPVHLPPILRADSPHARRVAHDAAQREEISKLQSRLNALLDELAETRCARSSKPIDVVPGQDQTVPLMDAVQALHQLLHKFGDALITANAPPAPDTAAHPPQVMALRPAPIPPPNEEWRANR